MKTLTNSLSQTIQTKTGLEPVLLVEVQIPDNSLYFSDRIINRNNINWVGKILELGDLQTEERLDLVGSISTINIVVEDSSDTLRELLNQKRFVGSTVKIYHTFGSTVENVLLFSGKLTTPLIWKEENKTLSFDSISRIDSREIGIQVTEKDYVGAIAGVAGVAFGTVINACLPKIYDAPPVKFARDWGDFGTWLSIPASWLPDGWYGSHEHAIAVQEAYGDYDFILSGSYMKWLPALQLDATVTDSTAYFPQNQEIDLYFDEKYGQFKGIFNGTLLTITQWQRQYGSIPTWTYGSDEYGNWIAVPKNNFNGHDPIKCCLWYRAEKSRGILEDELTYHSKTIYITWYREHDQNVGVEEGGAWRLYTNHKGDELESTFKLDIFAAAVFGPWNIPADTRVLVEDVDYVEAYALPVTGYNNLKIYAYQAVNDQRALKEIPTDAYRITTNYRGLGFDALELIYPLENYNYNYEGKWDVKWDNQLYFSFSSSQGTNVSDIIKHLLENYTNISVDSATFLSVWTLVDKYPANFAITEIKDALTAISEIAWQSRCAVNINNGIAKIKYLSKRPDAVALVNDSEIEEASVVLHCDDEDEVITHLTAQWKIDCTSQKDTELVYKNNVDIYGLRKQNYVFYIYAHQQLIQKSLNFWGQRYSNIWKRVQYKTFLTTMAFEFLDPIVINTSLHNSLALVEEMSHDSNENAISFDHWTPILIGTNSESSLAWLDDSNDVKPNAPPIMEAPSFNLTISYKILILPRKREESSDDDSVTPAKAVSDQDEYDQFLVDLYPNGYDGPKGERVTVTAVGDSKVKTNDQVTVYQSDNKYFATTGGGSGGIPAKTTSTVNTSTGALTIDIYANGFEQTATETGKTAYSLNKAQISTGKEVLVALVNNVYQVVSGSVNEDVAVARLTTTANITLSGAQTLDSVAVANNDIVLVKNQSSSTTNGRYKVNTSGAWTFVDLPSFVVIKEGTLYARTAWIKTATYTYSGLAAIPI